MKTTSIFRSENGLTNKNLQLTRIARNIDAYLHDLTGINLRRVDMPSANVSLDFRTSCAIGVILMTG